MSRQYWCAWIAAVTVTSASCEASVTGYSQHHLCSNTSHLTFYTAGEKLALLKEATIPQTVCLSVYMYTQRLATSTYDYRNFMYAESVNKYYVIFTFVQVCMSCLSFRTWIAISIPHAGTVTSF